MLVGIMALFPAVGHALALGKLKVLSALNEPLNAEIEFTSVNDKELKGLSVALASRADFEAAGVERLPFLSQVKFVVDQRPDGRHFLQLRTDQQIDEPFLHFLLQVEWPGGRLVREYTALIDPPYKIAGKAAPVETPVVTPPAPAPMPETQPAPPAPVAEAPPMDMMKEEIPPVAAAPETQKAPEEPKAEAAPPKEEVAQQVPPPETVPAEQKLGPPEMAQGVPPEEPGAPKVEPLEAAPTAEPAPEAPPPAAPEAVPAQAQMAEYNVQRGDTLWRIAEQARADNRDVSIEQMILAIYRTNQDAFFGNNVNNLKAGKILKMPEREAVEATTTSEARREFRAQYSAWQEYKLKLASASGAVKVPEPTEAALEAPVPAPAPVPAKEVAKPAKPAPAVVDKNRQEELLKIVRSTLQREKSTPDQKVAEKESAQETATREQQALADRAATLEESLESKRLENKELSEKVGVVRSQLSKESRLIDLESQSLAQQPKPAEAKPVEPAAKPAEPAPKPAEPVTAPAPQAQAKAEPLPPAKPARVAPKKTPAPPAPPPEKDFLATVLEAVQSDLLVPVVIGIVVLLSGGIALVYFRRRQKSIAEFEESILSADAISTESPATTGTVVGQQSAAATTGGDTSFLSDFSQGGMGNIHTDEVDPIAEAEVYLAYGRDETAEEILKEAMVKNPDRQEIKLKLLEIYHQRNDVSAFETLAEELYAAQGGRGGKVWDKVEEMGRKLNPGNPMFRGGAPGKAPAGAAPARPEAVTKPAATAPSGVNFPAASTETAKTELAGDFDFDIESPAPESNKTAAGGDDFSVMMPETPSRAKEETSLESLELGGAADSGLDFDVGGGEAPGAPAGNEIKWEPAAPAAGAEMDLEAAAAPAGNGEGSAQWDEAATKLDLAKAYIDMGDAEGARSILQEVMAEGSEAQKKQAQELSSQIA
ncbi:hypothetical protein SCL_1887 [Sulfuricaulis limicola]|uniref:LysM domain-containing protein n=2 Tax=Sulfuricaulis limicola TaxID=1620215 RepID=A0A1B4XHA5_9GAMM|nr:hypothetical protein SCL_1887 [Sulfuricaulis limicola]